MTTEVRPAAEGSTYAAVLQAVEAMQAFREFVGRALVSGLDYGLIPGATKPSLWQPGAQKIALFFNAYPRHRIRAHELGGGHVEYRVTTILRSRGTHKAVGSGVGLCTTMESRYRYRQAARTCPACGAEAIQQSKAEYGGGWWCNRKRGGCGVQFKADHPESARIARQPVGRLENDNPYDVRNSALKVGVKRAMVAAAMALSGASELFTQDAPPDGAEVDPGQAEEPPPPPAANRSRAGGASPRPGWRPETPPPLAPAPPPPRRPASKLESMIQTANDEWDTECVLAGIPRAMRGDWPTLVRHPNEAINHLTTWAIEDGFIDAAEVAKDDKPDARDHIKAVAAIRKLYATIPAEVDAEVEFWLRHRLTLARADLELPDPDIAPEDISQEPPPAKGTAEAGQGSAE